MARAALEHTVWAVALGLSLGCATSSPFQQRFLELSSPHFEILSSLGAEETTALATELELFHAGVEYALGLPVGVGPVGERVRVYAFDDRSPARPFALRGAPSAFLTGYDAPILVLRKGGGFGDSTAWVRHRYAHYVLRSRQTWRPLWYEEGRAQVAGSIEVRPPVVFVGDMLGEHVFRLRDWSGASLEETLATGDLSRWSTRDREHFRSESWALVHYLMSGRSSQGEAPAELAVYTGALDEGLSPRQAARRALGVDRGTLAEAVRDHVHRAEFERAAMRMDLGWAADLEARAVSLDRSRARLAELALALGRPGLARSYFERALRHDDSNPTAHAGLGAALCAAGRFEEGLAGVERALELAEEDAEVQRAAATCRRDWGAASADAATRRQRLARAHRHYARSVELDPGDAATWAEAGASYLLEGEDAARGLPWLAAARERQPGSLELALLEARLQARLGHRASARATAAEVVSRTHSKDTEALARTLLAETSRSP